MIDHIIKTIKNQTITPTQWIIGFSGILFVRFILESLSSPTSSGIIPSDPYTLIHYGLFFLSVTLATTLIVGKIIKNHKHSIKIILFGLPLLWLAPLIDIIVSKGRGYKMLYIFDSGKKIIFDFLTFFGPELTKGATYGIRIGILFSILGLGYFIWLESKKIKKVLIGMFLIYCVVFIGSTLPGIIYTISHIKNSSSTETVSYLRDVILQSNISHNTIRNSSEFISKDRFFELAFDKFISQILFLISCILGGLLFWNIDSKKFLSVVRNARIERVNFYIASLLCGIGFAYINRLGNPFVWVDILGILCLTVSWVSLWMNAVHTNDIIDVDIDKISNPNRPLVKHEVNVTDMHEIGNMWLVIALLGSWSAGFYPFFMCLVYIACSYIYSTPPLRLRRFPAIPSFLIAVACLSTVLAGFFFISVRKEIFVFPPLLSIGILIMVTLAINFKDIKDIEGDKANGIITLPILFGDKGVQIVAVLFALSILLVPIFLSFWLLYIIATPASVIGYKLITKKPYNEKPIFILRFFFLGGIGIAYILIYWLAYVYKLN